MSSKLNDIVLKNNQTSVAKFRAVKVIENNCPRQAIDSQATLLKKYDEAFAEQMQTKVFLGLIGKLCQLGKSEE